jgi:hypothetical protein
VGIAVGAEVDVGAEVGAIRTQTHKVAIRIQSMVKLSSSTKAGLSPTLAPSAAPEA